MISVVLLPSEKDSQQIVQFSKRLTNSHFFLGDKALPHITICLFDAPVERAGDLWEEVNALVTGSIELTSGGLGFVLDHQGGQVWVELQFLSTEQLLAAQAAMLATTFAKSFQPMNAIAKSYRPHCTLGVTSEESSTQVQLNNAPIFQRTFSNMRLAVGVNGELFTFAEPLFTRDV